MTETVSASYHLQEMTKLEAEIERLRAKIPNSASGVKKQHDEIIHDQGFRDGLKFVAKQLYVAAERVEKPQRSTFEKDGKHIEAIAHVGQPHLARKYRELADELLRLVTQ